MKKVLVFLIVVFSLGLVGFSRFAYGDNIPIETKKDVFYYELGSIPKNINNYINVLDDDVNVEKDSNIKYRFPKIDKVGQYKVILKYKDTDLSFIINVLDTTKPVFDSFTDSIELDFGSSKVNLPEFKASDLSGVTVTVDDSNVNYSLSGDYKLIVSAKDGCGNTEVRESKVHIKEEVKPQVIEEVKVNKEDKVYKKSNVSSANTSKDTSNIENNNVYDMSLSIPGLFSNRRVVVGSTQSAVDSNDICLMTAIASTPGSGQPILLGGHNNRSLGGIYRVNVGSVIVFSYYGNTYRYRVTDSVECTTKGPDLTNIHTGENMLERRTGREVLQIYTCYGNNRWLVKAIKI